MSWPFLAHTSPYHSRSVTYISDHSHQVVNWNPEEAAVVQRANIERYWAQMNENMHGRGQQMHGVHYVNVW